MKKRICIITGAHWAASRGGTQYQAKCLADELVKNGRFEVFYLARIINPRYQPEGYKIIKIAGYSGLRRYGLLFDAHQLNRQLKKIQPDVIYQRGLKAYTGIAAKHAVDNSCRLIMHIASDNDVIPLKYQNLPKHTVLKRLDKKIGEYGMRRANDIIAQTKRQAGLLKEYYRLDTTTIIPNAHPLPDEKIEKQRKPIQVIWIGNFKPIKRPEVFVKLARDLVRFKDVEFIMIGRPGAKKLYNNLHAQIEEIPNLKYLSELPISDVNKILARGHIYVNTSLVEGFPNTFIQAWMRKEPVVSSVNTDDILEDNQVGFYGDTYENLKKSLICLLSNERLRTAMGGKAEKYAIENHSFKNMEKLISIM